MNSPGNDWRPLGDHAVTHHMAIDSVYLGRTDGVALDALRAREKQVLQTGDFEPQTLYILDPASALLAKPLLTPDDLFVRVDDRIVVAKGDAHLADGLDLQPPL